MPKNTNASIYQTINADLRRVVEGTKFLRVQSDSKEVTTDTGFSSIVGRRRKPLVIRY